MEWLEWIGRDLVIFAAGVAAGIKIGSVFQKTPKIDLKGGTAQVTVNSADPIIHFPPGTERYNDFQPASSKVYSIKRPDKPMPCDPAKCPLRGGFIHHHPKCETFEYNRKTLAIAFNPSTKE